MNKWIIYLTLILGWTLASIVLVNLNMESGDYALKEIFRIILFGAFLTFQIKQGEEE